MEPFAEALFFMPAFVSLLEFLFFLLEAFLLDVFFLLEVAVVVWDPGFFAVAENPVALLPLVFLTSCLAFFDVGYLCF